MPIIHRDFETRSAVNLKKVGARRYALGATTSVLCICYAVDDGPIESFVPEDGKPAPDVFVEAAHNPDWSVAAHNDPFESAIEEYVLAPRFNWPRVPIERHICTMAMARYHGLPGELGKVAALLDLPIQKDRDGARLMLELCKPRKPHPGEDPAHLYWPEITPEKLKRLIVYCKNDVEIEREIFRRLPLLPDEEHRLWCLDRKINVRGFRGDLEFADSACKLVGAEKARINGEIVSLTDGAVTGFTKLNDMREFINARGHNMTKLNERAVMAVLAHDPDDTVRTVLELRQASSNTAVAKYAAVLASAFPDQRIYGLLNYYGAHTGRWTSAGFNVHNLPREDSSDALVAIDAIRRGDLERVRTFGPPLEVIARLARGLVVAPPDKLLLAGDFSVVEPRVASWLTEEKWKLDTFRKFDETGDPKLDAHRVVGARMRGQPVDPTDDEARQHGKTVHMALNYGGSVRVWREHVPDDPRSDEEIKTQEINKFRQLHPAQTRFMFNLDKQALHCVRYRQPVRRERHSFEMDGDTLILRLPSGRPLFYPRAHLKPGRFGKNVVAYHNPAKNCEDQMWYGAWFAHLVSATSRDLLVNALFNLDAAGFDIILHVHDEIVAEIDPANVEHDRERFKACMLAAPAWATGLPLAAKVRVGPRYIKTDAPIEIKVDTIVESGASIVATEVASIQPQDGCFGATEAPADSDFRIGGLPGGLESEHNPVHAENGASDERVEAHICAQCHLNPPDGGERLSAYNDEWLHPRCEEAFIRARMAEEGLPWEMPTAAEPPPTAAFGEAPPPPLPPRQISGGGAPTSGNGGTTWADDSDEDDARRRHGSKTEAARDTYAEKHDGKPFNDAFLRFSGYHLADVFDYTLADGTLLYHQSRYELNTKIAPTKEQPSKRFLPHRSVNGKDIFGAGDRRAIYNWPAIMRAGPGCNVYICEGESNAKALITTGLLATTVLSHKWTPECIAALTGCHLFILQDHDKDGEKLATNAQRQLAPVAASTRIIPAPHLWKHLPPEAREIEPGDDIKDWVELGGDPQRLLNICREIPADGIITAEPYQFREEVDIPPWQWLYGRHLLRGEVAGTAATGGTGKSTLSIVEALAMASGRALLGERVAEPLRVVLVNLEDTGNTMDKRIAAAMRQHGLTPADIGDRLIVKAKGEIKIKVARQRRSGDVERNTLTIRALTILMREHHADVLSIDSFIRTHQVNENDNSAMQGVVECFEDIAVEAECAVHLWHHTRKTGGERATIESIRGAVAFIDACRSARVLETMSAKEHEQLLAVQPDMLPPGFYFRAFNGKRNFAPPAEQSDWFELKSIVLLNGDDVGVATTWTYPETWENITPEITDVIFAEIDRGMPDGQRYSNHNRATRRQAWPLVRKHCPAKTENQCRRIVAAWIKQGALYEDEYPDPVQRRRQLGLFVRKTITEEAAPSESQETAA